MRNKFAGSLRAIILLSFLFTIAVKCQTVSEDAELIRKKFQIPELAYAVVSSDSVLEIQVSGFKRINSKSSAALTDKFHLGSNAKAITGFVAARLVKQKQLNWNTKFFDLFPELKAKSNPVYYEMTLQDLLTFRAKLPPYTYTNALPKKSWFRGDDEKQRLQLVSWFLKQKPSESKTALKLTNAGYIAAGLMLEKASGKNYRRLVNDLGAELKIDFGFDYPNLQDASQTWGHDANLNPVPPQKNYKLNWLLPAGNVNVNLPDYIKFVQLQLQGLSGKSNLLTAEEFNFLHYGAPEFSVGWFWEINENNHRVSHNTGNAGAFITEVYVVKEIDRAYILFANSSSEKTSAGLKILLDKMMSKYGR